MRHAVPLLLLLAVACSDPAPITDPPPDGAGDPPDADPPSPDADPPPPDGGEPPLPTTTAEVTLRYRQHTDEGQPVVFSGADGRLLALVETDADGRALGPMEDGGMVTFLYAPGSGLYTIADVQVDDQIVWDDLVNAWPDPGPVLDTVTVTMPGEAVPGADGYGVSAGTCWGEGTTDPGATITIDMYAPCIGEDGSFDVLAWALTDEQEYLAYSIVPRASGDAVAAAPWRTDWGRDVTITNLDPATTSSNARIGVAYDGPILWSIGSPVEPVVEPGQAVHRVAIPASLGERQHVAIGVWQEAAGQPETWQSLRRWTEGMEPPVVDAADLLPRFTAMALRRDDDPARPIASWELAGDPGDDADLIQLAVWGTGSWEMVVPATRREVQFPELPDQLAAHRPTTSTLETLILEDDPARTWSDARVAQPSGYPDVGRLSWMLAPWEPGAARVRPAQLRRPARAGGPQRR